MGNLIVPLWLEDVCAFFPVVVHFLLISVVFWLDEEPCGVVLLLLMSKVLLDVESKGLGELNKLVLKLEDHVT